MKTDPPDSNSGFELRAQLLRLLKRETYRQRQQRLLVEKKLAFLTLRQQVRLEQRIARKLKHPSAGNLTWLQVKALKLWDEIDTLNKELNE
jgi:hypothetical protein